MHLCLPVRVDIENKVQHLSSTRSPNVHCVNIVQKNAYPALMDSNKLLNIIYFDTVAVQRKYLVLFLF